MTHIINCAAKLLPNYWEHLGIKYLTYYWTDKSTQVILDSKDKIANQSYDFINEALEANESVLIHSGKNQNRACIIAALWIMRKYRWSLLKTLEFLNYRKPNLDIRTHFIQQLTAYESRLISKGKGPKTSKWEDVFDKENPLESEELLLRNTYINAQTGKFNSFIYAVDRQYPLKVKWIDQVHKAPLTTFIESHHILEVNDIHKRAGEDTTEKQQEESIKNEIEEYNMDVTKNSITEMIKQHKELKTPKSIYEYEASNIDQLTTTIELATNIANNTPKDAISHRLIETNSKSVYNKLDDNECKRGGQVNYINSYIIQNPQQVQIINYPIEKVKGIKKNISINVRSNTIRKYVPFIIIEK